MNIANQLTILRILLIPLLLVFLLSPFSFGHLEWFGETISYSRLIALILFLLASGTDWIDGYVARKYGLVTNLGKFLDPLADKLLVTAAFVSLVALQLVPAWMVIVILAREFAVTGLRLVAAGEGMVIAAGRLGKWKTLFQLLSAAFLMIENAPFQSTKFSPAMILLWIAVILTVVSGIDYFRKNFNVLIEDHTKGRKQHES